MNSVSRPDDHGFRGYISSRPIDGSHIPQHVQNLVIRHYASRHGLTYLLSATEFSIPNSYIVLEDVLAELPRIGGIICYSRFLLPLDKARRQAVYKRVLKYGAALHFAVENISISNSADVRPLEDLWSLREILPEAEKILAGIK